MQAIILAAGMGKRLGELTRHNTKCMIKINGVTLIERMLTQLDNLNLNKIILVIGYKGKELKNFISEYINIKTEIEFVENPIYDKTNNIYSLYLAKDYLLKDDTLLLESDLIFDNSILPKLINETYPSLALVAKYENWMDGTVVTIDEENNIKSFIPVNKFQFEDIPGYFKTVNIYKFSKEFSTSHYVPFLEAYSKALGNNEYYEQVLRVITLLEKPEIKALKLNNEKWYEIDDIQDLDIAESVFSDDDEKINKFHNRYGGYWRYPKLLDFCYLVNPFFPPQKLIDEIKANLEKLITQYPSGQEVNSLLASKMFNISQNQIAVGNGAAEIINILATYIKEKIGIMIPTFEEYTNRMHDKIICFKTNNNNFIYGIDEIKKCFDNLNYFILINPDNPSGNYINKSEILNLLEWCLKNKKNIIVDESFIDFSIESTNGSLIRKEILENYPNLILIKSISKSYGVPGCRIGFIASGNTELIRYIKNKLSIWNINSFGEFFLQIIGKYEKSYIEACNKLILERDRLYNELSRINFLRVIPSQSNYFLCEVNNFTSRELTKRLLTQEEIFIKDCSEKLGFENKQYIRIAIRNKEDNDKLVNSLKKQK